MNWDGEKQTLRLEEKTQEKVRSESIYPPENIGRKKRSRKDQRYRTIFNCRYTEVKE